MRAIFALALACLLFAALGCPGPSPPSTGNAVHEIVEPPDVENVVAVLEDFEPGRVPSPPEELRMEWREMFVDRGDQIVWRMCGTYADGDVFCSGEKIRLERGVDPNAGSS